MTDTTLSPEAAAPYRRRARQVLLPGMVAMSMGQTALFAVFGPTARQIGLPEHAVGVIVSSSALAFVLSSIVWGRIADRWGRRNVAAFALATYGLTSIGFAAALHAGLEGWAAPALVFALLLVTRITYGTLGAGLQPAAIGYMADTSSREERASAVALVGAAYGIGTVLGPAAAAALAGFGVMVPLYAIGLLGLAGAAACALALPEPPRPRARARQSAPFRLRPLMPILLISFLIFVAVSTMQQTIAFFVQDALEADAARTAQAAGGCFAAMALAMILMQAGVIPRLRPKPLTLVCCGLPIALVGLASFAIDAGYPGLVIASAVMGMGFGLATPGVNSALSLAVGADAQGRAAGLGQAAASCGFIVGPLAGTWLYGASPTATLVLAVAAVAIALSIGLVLRRRAEA